jgi:Family of unknown function (DUF6516)
MAAFSRADYETFLYTLSERYPQVRASTVRLYSNSATTGFVRGSVYFVSGLELRVFEYLDLIDGELFNYSYTVFRGEQIIRWYDPQPHPEDTKLAETFPHHVHEGPDIKHHRLPAQGISFSTENLVRLIEDCLKVA